MEFGRLTERGGVLGAMETGYQRGKIQDESAAVAELVSGQRPALQRRGGGFQQQSKTDY